MARIIHLHDNDTHLELQSLLPWYVTGRLDPAEHARVEAHLASCADCQDEVRFERTLAKTVKELPIDAEVGWRRLERRLEAEPPRQVGAATSSANRTVMWGGWAMAACALVAVGVMATTRAPQEQVASGQYHVLGAAHSVTQGNMVVIFRPDTPERTIRAELTALNARIVDGPTSADAYVLQVPAARRADALAKLRARPNIVLAEPVDPGAAP